MYWPAAIARHVIKAISTLLFHAASGCRLNGQLLRTATLNVAYDTNVNHARMILTFSDTAGTDSDSLLPLHSPACCRLTGCTLDQVMPERHLRAGTGKAQLHLTIGGLVDGFS